MRAVLRAFRRPRWVLARVVAILAGGDVWVVALIGTRAIDARFGPHAAAAFFLDLACWSVHAALSAALWWAAAKIEPTRLIVIDALGGAVLRINDALSPEQVERIRSTVRGTVRLR